jgi:hypothetical protein
MMTLEEQRRERDREMDRLIAEARERRFAKAREYYSKPHPPRTEEEERQFARDRRDAARILGATVAETCWDPVSEAWTCR